MSSPKKNQKKNWGKWSKQRDEIEIERDHRVKNTWCEFYNRGKGRCFKGDDCNFRHYEGNVEDQRNPNLFRVYLSGETSCSILRGSSSSVRVAGGPSSSVLLPRGSSSSVPFATGGPSSSVPVSTGGPSSSVLLPRGSSSSVPVAAGGPSSSVLLPRGSSSSVVIFELPYNIRCGGCNSMIAKGVQRFNSEMTQVGKIWSFAMKLPCCNHEMVIQTEHSSSECGLISGAQKIQIQPQAETCRFFKQL